MSQIHKSRDSEHPLIETVWQTKNTADGVYQATPDASWDLIVLIAADGSKQMMITGQATRPMQVPYQKGTGSVVISFVAGAYMPHYPAENLLDQVEMLPNFDADHFSMAGHTFPFPTFENAEDLVEQMIKLHILKYDEIVGGILTEDPKAISERAQQRHFKKSTGLSQKYLEQIKQAQSAVSLLQQGKKPVDVAHDTGYSDQSHMAKSLKKIMDTKPSKVQHIHKLPSQKATKNKK